METLTQHSFIFIGEHELNLHLKNPDPVFKINLYKEKLEEKPMETWYIKFLEGSELESHRIDKVIRTIIRDHANYALAFQFECLNRKDKDGNITN
ncbi:hypothetical protein SYJ56_24550 [Algoriphagus sp. D3-2-R+10]|uniref:hypothetical protein n=1 Tax=Algoriphagus aurantiacus TaxID=3103948 RepID=UPI002B39C145|nr:hypothetical protein [Algoriphagus sp. D3-2-R+10]MEB2778502.1 hypothetical protein [Algoriphagus sp. D3-2-R+10]